MKNETHVRDKPEGLLWESDDPKVPSKIWVKSWAQIINDCRTRLRVFERALNLTANKGIALSDLRKTYERLLLGKEEEENNGDNKSGAKSGDDEATASTT